MALEIVAVAGFWRRIGAFAVDLLILGLVGLGLGQFLSEQFVALGPWARLVGFTIAFVYFGVLNSAVAGGQTPGKLWLGIKVVDAANQPLSLGKSALRYLPLGIPYFLNNAPFTSATLLGPMSYVLTFAIFGFGLSLLYLYVFNTRTRQSLHDLLVGSYVVPTDATRVPPERPWRGHYAVVGVLLVGWAIAPYFIKGLIEAAPFKGMMEVVRAIESEPDVSHVNVALGIYNSTESGKRHSFEIEAILRANDVEDAARAARFVAKALEAYPAASEVDIIAVQLSYGYDIGIAESWNRYNHTGSVQDWRQALVQGGT